MRNMFCNTKLSNQNNLPDWYNNFMNKKFKKINSKMLKSNKTSNQKL